MPQRSRLAAKGGNDADQAFALHVVPELDVLFRVALSITKNTANAEDLVQDTLLRAYRSIERFDGAHPRAWLLTIMRNARISTVFAASGRSCSATQMAKSIGSPTPQITPPAPRA